MSSAIAPLPTGAGVTVIADRHQQQGGSRPDSDDADERRKPQNPGNGAQMPAPRTTSGEAPLPDPQDDPVPAETLFAVTLLANSMPQSMALPEALRQAGGPDWTPPDSSLHLKDKTI